ncbi:MAG: pitrilysin family protein [Gemmatimonadota bacterium]|nr:pitrilysin family protein [Gemmatimonadota bacterium]
MLENIKRILEDNGLRIVLESIPHVRSCSVGVWINRGSRHEPQDKVGISHFLEHMVFKGTDKRNAREIASSIESAGGSIDAFTGREYTCFHAKVLDEYLELAIDVLSDLIHSPTLSEENLEREKQVVYEEIRNMEDTPDDLVHQLYSQTVWGDHPLGYPLLGNYQTVGALKREDVLEFLQKKYIAPNIVISVAGNIDFDSALDTIRTRFSFLSRRAGATDVSNHGGAVRQKAAWKEKSVETRHIDHNCQQTHLCMGTVSFAHTDPRRYSLLLLSNIMGGGMSSRLFQRVREEEALAYVVYSFQQFYLDTGLFGVYVGVEPTNRDKAIQVVLEENRKLYEHGVSDEELSHAKNQLKGQLLMGLESTTTRMYRMASYELNGMEYQRVDKVIEMIEKVGPEDISEVAGMILAPQRIACVSLGPNNNGG